VTNSNDHFDFSGSEFRGSVVGGRHRVWVPREQSAAGRLAWEVDEARRWGDLGRERAALSRLAAAWAAAGYHQGAEHALRRLAEISEGDEGGEAGVTTPTPPSPAP
jgi:hypothetical protein